MTALFIPHHSGEERADTSPHASAASSRADLTGWQYAWPTTTSTTSAPTTTEAPKVTHAVAPRVSRGCGRSLDQIGADESHNDYGAVNPSSGAGGRYQILPSTWRSNGGSGLPQNASPAEQDRIAQKIYTEQGTRPWRASGC